MDGFERRKEQKKENIRRAALELFQVYGFKKVSINDIAQKAGASQVTIYTHFGSKDGLVRDVVKNLIYRMIEKHRDIVREEKPFLEKLEAIVFYKSEVVGQFQGELSQTAFSQDSEMHQFMESAWQGEVNQIIIDLFEDGKRQGYITHNLSQEAILLYYEIFRQGMYHSPHIQAKLEHNPKLIRELVSAFTYGLNG